MLAMLLQMKQDDSSSQKTPSDVYIVQDTNQARLLTDPTSVRYFKPFVAAERTLSEVAGELDCALNALHYRVRQFVEAGLLVMSRETPRAGRAIKHYRSVRARFFIPSDLTPYATLEEGIAEQLAPVWDMLHQGLAASIEAQSSFGRLIFRDEQDVVVTSDSATPAATFSLRERPASDTFYSDIFLSLTPEQVQWLERRLRALFSEVITHATDATTDHNERDSNTQTYLLQAALVPISE